LVLFLNKEEMAPISFEFVVSVTAFPASDKDLSVSVSIFAVRKIAYTIGQGAIPPLGYFIKHLS
jgi:hypothetical protein